MKYVQEQQKVTFESEIRCFCCELNHTGAHLGWNYSVWHLHVTMASYCQAGVRLTSLLIETPTPSWHLDFLKSNPKKSMVIMDT